MKAIVKERQSAIDVAVQYLGNAEGAFIVAEKLGISITDKLTPGVAFEYEASEVIDARIAKYYKDNNITPSTYNE